ncbi:hypothetical protein BBJ28_00018627 [Nothophytophthora sp. Chile5]|nr:hypothetical protein BBJ28_00018627 [Nothophytophthora sp. Chile5]
MSARDVTSPPLAEAQNLDNDAHQAVDSVVLGAREPLTSDESPQSPGQVRAIQEEATSDPKPRLLRTPSRPIDRLVTTSAVAAALAELEGDRPKRRKVESHSVTLPDAAPRPVNEADTPSKGHRFSASALEGASFQHHVHGTEPVNLQGTTPTLESATDKLDVVKIAQLKRSTNTQLASIRDRLKGAGGGSIATKQAPRTVASTTLVFKRASSSSGGPSFLAVAKAVAGTTAKGSAADITKERAQQGQHYEEMMARFQLRRLEHSDLGKGMSAEAPAVMRRANTRVTPFDSDLSRRYSLDDLTVFSRPRSNDNIQQESSVDVDASVLSPRSHTSPRSDPIEGSPREAGVPPLSSRFALTSSSMAMTATATASTSSAHFAPSTVGMSTESFTTAAKNMVLLPLPIFDPTHDSQQAPVLAQMQSFSRLHSTTRHDSGLSVVDLKVPTARVGSSRPRPLSYSKQQLRRLLARLRTPLSPFSWTARVRTCILLLAFCIHALGFPYNIAFHLRGRAWFFSVDAATELLFFADFLLAFNTSFVNKRGVLVASRRHIVWNFLTGSCVPQLLGALPVVTTLIMVGSDAGSSAPVDAEESDAYQRFTLVILESVLRSHRVVHMLRLFREVGQVREARTDRSIWGWLLYSRYSHLLRIVWIVGAVMLIAHYVACCWRMLHIASATQTTSSLSTACGGSIGESGELKVYAECFYEAMQMLQGQSLTTHSTDENIFASFVNLLGSIVLAVIFGHVAMLVANFNANSTAYQRKMESVFAGMTKMQLPPSLRERIHQYYAHLWQEYEALDGAPLARFAKELSHNLTLEVVLFKYMELAMHVPFWENCSPDFQKTLVLSLDTRVYLPDDFLVRRGEVGDEFYMINRGVCELVGSNDTLEHATEPLSRRRGHVSEHSDPPADSSMLYMTCFNGTHDLGPGKNSTSNTTVSGVTKTLTRGQAFGEMALLMNYQRTANVRAVTHMEMCVLSRSAFQAILTRYPADRKHVLSQILITTLENNERFGVPCPLTAMVHSVFDAYVNVTDGEQRITPRQAARLIASAVNPAVEDDSIKLALGARLKEQLAAVRDQELGVMSISGAKSSRQATETTRLTTPAASTACPLDSPPTSQSSSRAESRKHSRSRDPSSTCCCGCHGNDSPTTCGDGIARMPPVGPDSEMEMKLLQVEMVQTQALTLIQELQRGIQESLHPRSESPPNALRSTTQQSNLDTATAAALATEMALRLQPQHRGSVTRVTGSSLSGTERRGSFVRASSVPIFSNQDMVGLNAKPTASPRSSFAGVAKNAIATEDSSKSSSTTVRTLHPPPQRATTTRLLKISDGGRPLRALVGSSAHSRARRADSGSNRFIQRMTSQLASLTSTNLTTQASPTWYADRLFQPRREREPTTRESQADGSSFREDQGTSSVSEQRYH